MKLGDPSDKPVQVVKPERMQAAMLTQSLDAQADGNFGGKHGPANRRAGYGGTVVINGEELTDLEWLIRRAKKDATLASGEGRKLIEHYEAQMEELRHELSIAQLAVEQQAKRLAAVEAERDAALKGFERRGLDEIQKQVALLFERAERTERILAALLDEVVSTSVSAAEQEASHDQR